MTAAARREAYLKTLLEETLYEEALLPVCSLALLAARGRPRSPAALRDWPLLYDLGWDADWSYWFARQGQPTPDLSRASGFRLYSMLVQAAASGLGAAIGRPMPIAHELERRVLVPLFDRQVEAPERCCLITTAASRQRPATHRTVLDGEVTKYAFDARDEPVLHVKQEESFQIETDDALSGLIEDDSDNPKVHQFVGDARVDALNAPWPPKYSPVVGPIYVEGCEAGDVLAVNLETIDPWRYGFSGILPGIGPYGESSRWDGQCAVPRVPPCNLEPASVRSVQQAFDAGAICASGARFHRANAACKPIAPSTPDRASPRTRGTPPSDPRCRRAGRRWGTAVCPHD